MRTNKTEYSISNFNAVNDFIDEENRYASHFRKYKIARLFKRYALYTSLFILSVAILILFAGIAYWLWHAQPNQIFKSTTTNVTNYNLKDDSEELKELLNDIEANSGEISQSIEKEFVIFQSQSYELENGDLTSVHTGWSFKPEELSYPYQQYCYLSLKSKTSTADYDRVNLMDKFGIENPVEVEFDSNKVGYYDFEAAKSKCIFKY